MVMDESLSWTVFPGLLSLTVDLHRISARNSPKQAKKDNLTREELSDWKKSYNDLEAEKQKLIYDCKEIERKKQLCKMNKTQLISLLH